MSEPAAPGRNVTARDIRIGIVLMLCGTALFGCGESVVKLLTRHYDTMQIVWGRYVFHAIVFLAIFARTGIVAQMRTARPWLQFSRSAILLTGTLLYFGALRYLALADAVAINFFAPLLVTAFSIPMLKEQVGIRRWIAILVGFAGVMVIIRPGLGVMHWAAILPLGTAVCYALYQVLTRMAGRTDHARTSLFWSAAVGTVVMSLIVPFRLDRAGRARLGHDGGDGMPVRARALSPDQGAGARAGFGALALHIQPADLGDHAGLSGVRRFPGRVQHTRRLDRDRQRALCLAPRNADDEMSERFPAGFGSDGGGQFQRCPSPASGRRATRAGLATRARAGLFWLEPARPFSSVMVGEGRPSTFCF